MELIRGTDMQHISIRARLINRNIPTCLWSWYCLQANILKLNVHDHIASDAPRMWCIKKRHRRKKTEAYCIAAIYCVKCSTCRVGLSDRGCCCLYELGFRYV
jgi:hypothetical protein